MVTTGNGLEWRSVTLSVLYSVWKCFLYSQGKHDMSVGDDLTRLLRSISGYHKQHMKRQNEAVVILHKRSIRKPGGNKLVTVNWNGLENVSFSSPFPSTVISSAVLTWKEQIQCEFWNAILFLLIMFMSTYAYVYTGHFRGFSKQSSNKLLCFLQLRQHLSTE